MGAVLVALGCALVERRSALSAGCAAFALVGVRLVAPSPPAAPALPEGDVVWELAVVDGARPATREGTFVARALAWRTRPGEPWHDAGVVVVVRDAPAEFLVRRGDRLWLVGRLREAPEWDGRRRLGVRAPPVWVGARRTPGRWLDGVRIRMERSVLTRTRAPASGVLLALLSGTRAGLDPSVRRLFADAGAAHVLAVSGLHLGLLAAFSFGALRAAFRVLAAKGASPSADQVAAGVTLLVVVAYVVLTGAPTSACRAGWMAGALLVARASERSARAADALGWAVAALLVVDPATLGDVGAQLSVGATAGLVAMPSRSEGWVRSTWRASWVASAWTALPLAWHFGVIPLASPLSSMVLVPPLALVALPAAALGAALDALGLPGARAALGVAEAAVRGALWIGRALEGALTPTWVVGRPAALGVLGFAGLCLASLASGRRQVAAAAVALLLVHGDATQRRAGASLQVQTFTAGDERVSWVRFPCGATVLVDVGGTPRRNGAVFRWEVLPELRRAGVREVDAIVLTSTHYARAGDLSVARAELGEPPVFAPVASGEGGLAFASGALHWRALGHAAPTREWGLVACATRCVPIVSRHPAPAWFAWFEHSRSARPRASRSARPTCPSLRCFGLSQSETGDAAAELR